MIKKIELELWFDDDYVPPDKFDERLCTGRCPFLSHDACETSEGFCCITGAWRLGEVDCPIKKYFV